jgi:hypothetical protein
MKHPAKVEVTDKVGRKYLHRKFTFTSKELAAALKDGYWDDRYLQYYDSHMECQRESTVCEMFMKITINKKDGTFSFSLGKPADNMELLVAKGRARERKANT